MEKSKNNIAKEFSNHQNNRLKSIIIQVQQLEILSVEDKEKILTKLEKYNVSK